MAIAGTNTVSFNLNGGGPAFVGGTNSGALSLSNGSGSVNVIGANSGTLTLNSGGSVYLGGGTSGGGLNANGNATVQIQGNNGANINLHSHPYAGTFPGGPTVFGSGSVPAPEPAGLALIVTGLVGLAAVRRRRRLGV